MSYDEPDDPAPNEDEPEPDDHDDDFPERPHASAETWLSFEDAAGELSGSAVAITLEGILMVQFQGDHPDAWLELTPGQLRVLAAVALEAARNIEG